MRIILAASDRDLLKAYAQWFEDHDIPITTVFDSAQLQSETEARIGGICILDDAMQLPRRDAVLDQLAENGWKLITLSRDSLPDPEKLLLRHPLIPRELMNAIEQAFTTKEERQGAEHD